jgi:Ca-activated chloride channel family protein
VIRWGASQYLILLAVVPLLTLALAAGAWLKRRRLRRLADAALVPRLTDSLSPRLAALRSGCLLLGVTLLVIAVARPQWGEKLQVYKGRGIDIVVALDASKSMRATDIKPDRLTRAKSQIAALLDNLSTNRVGIVAFAGEAQVMCPLTPDVDAAKLFLDIIDPESMPKPGTNIQHAVEAAASLFDPKSEGSRVVLLVTDGDNLDGDPAATTRLAVEQGIRIFAVGVGTPEGSTIPESQGGSTTYKKDDKDQIVVSRLAERLLLVMAKATDGRYFRSETVNLEQVVAALDRLQKGAIGGGEYVEYEERYQAFLLPAFLLLFLGHLMSDRRGAWFRLPAFVRPRNPARTAAPPGAGAPSASTQSPAGAPAPAPSPAPPAALLPVLIAVLSLAGLSLAAGARAADVGSLMRRGLSLEKQGKYDEAIKAFQEAQVLEPDNIGIHYDLGRAQYEKKQFAESVDQFQLGLLSKNASLRARSLYNTGNGQFRQNRLQEAITFYSQSLLVRPDDLNAKQNLEYCWKMLEQAKQQPDSSGKQPPQNQPPPPKPEEQKAQPQQAAEEKGPISKDQAKRMLEALQRSEKENLRNQPKKPPARAAGGKDW